MKGPKNLDLYLEAEKMIFEVFCTEYHCDIEIGSKEKSAVYQHITNIGLVFPA